MREPPSKRRKVNNQRVHFSPSPEDEYNGLSYDEALSSLRKEWAKQKPKKNFVKKPLTTSLKERQLHIQDACPCIEEVVVKFPM